MDHEIDHVNAVSTRNLISKLFTIRQLTSTKVVRASRKLNDWDCVILTHSAFEKNLGLGESAKAYAEAC